MEKSRFSRAINDAHDEDVRQSYKGGYVSPHVWELSLRWMLENEFPDIEFPETRKAA